MQDPILGITEAFLADQNPDKMNLGVVSEAALPYMQDAGHLIMSTMGFQRRVAAIVVLLSVRDNPLYPRFLTPFLFRLPAGCLPR